MDMKSLSENAEDANRTGLDLLMTDACTALTLLDAAETTSLPENRSRRIEEARKAYKTISSLRGRLVLTASEESRLDDRLSLLRNRLIGVGVHPA